MFDELSAKLEKVFQSLRGEDRINESNVAFALVEVKKALIDADVSLDVANEFLNEVRKEAIGVEVVRGIKPEQKMVDIVHKKLIDIMGSQNEPLWEGIKKPGVLMLVGLQGAGKTTAAAKLGLYLKKKGKKVLLIAADTYRPAAREQLQTLGKQIEVEVFSGNEDQDAIDIVKKGLLEGTVGEYDYLIIDTAGRLFLDEALMNEVVNIRDSIRPDEILLVVDSMMGQEAAHLTKSFDDALSLTGTILTKLDGDSRGGAALSIRKVSGKPIKFVGVGEKVEALEAFYPDRIASRILGMGDILTLVDKAQQEVEMEDIITMQKKLQEASFDFDDFLRQMKLIRRMGSLGGLIKLIPGMNKIDNEMLKSGEKQLERISSMIGSMTLEERRNPDLISRNQSRRKRIASGSGNSSKDVEKAINDFNRMREMMRGLTTGAFSNANTKHGKKLYKNKGADQQHERRETVYKKKKGFFDL